MEQIPKEQTFHVPPENLQELIRDPNFPKHYANGFIFGKGENDVFLLTTTNGKAGLLLNISFSTAKKLHVMLQKQIQEIELQVGTINSLPPVVVQNKTK